VVPLTASGLFRPRPLHELEFLPAALEIIETPPSPTGRAVMLTIVGLMIFAIGWATVGKVDIIVTSQGRIIPSGKVKEIQPFEIGVVKSIEVHDGQHVAEGDRLIELDATTNAAEREKVARDLMHARLDVARLRSLLDDGHGDLFAALHNADPADVMTALSQMQAQAQEQAAKRETLDHQLAQKQAELAGIKATIDKLQASMPMIQSRVDIRAGGLKTEFGNKIDYLAATQALSEQQHEMVVQNLKIGETTQAIEALRKQRMQTDEEFRKTALADLAKAEMQVAEQSQEAIKINQKTELQSLRAPVAGTVQQLAVHTIGGVVTPAQTLLVLVPDDAHLEIEADIPNSEVGFVHDGQPVEIKIETFSFTRYGLLHGSVMSISRDSTATTNEQSHQPSARERPSETDDKTTQSRQPSYVALVSLDRTWIDTEQGRRELGPGMAVTAEIKTGRRRVISYLLSPLTRYRQEAGRER
jgi:hemolysin D